MTRFNIRVDKYESNSIQWTEQAHSSQLSKLSNNNYTRNDKVKNTIPVAADVAESIWFVYIYCFHSIIFTDNFSVTEFEIHLQFCSAN